MNNLKQTLSKIGQTIELVGFLAWFAMPAAFIYDRHLLDVCPTRPIGEYTIEMCEHGYFYYVTPAQSMIFNGLLFGGGIVFTICMLLGMRLQGINPFNGKKLYGPDDKTSKTTLPKPLVK